MIVTIDGPAGAGKSSIARKVAQRLGFEFLDTGAMYRAVTLGALRAGIDMKDEAELTKFAGSVRLRWVDQKIFLDDEDVSELIRTPEVTGMIRFVADSPPVRQLLSFHQRQIADGRDIVTEGRDQGTEVFPDAECKLFLTATSRERARRRQQQLAESGQDVPIEEILRSQDKRDLEDERREVGSLRQADDAVVINSDGLSPDEVIERALAIIADCKQRVTAKNGS